MKKARTVWGAGLSTIADDGTVLDAWFTALGHGAPSGNRLESELRALASTCGADDRRRVTVETVHLEIDLDVRATSTVDVYLRLHALSHLLVVPNDLNLDAIFGFLPTVAWTNAGPMHPDSVASLRPLLQRAGIQVHAIDKFPRLTDYVTPVGVRIADSSRVRLGAHLSPGTTVMHEGFVNFNAGTLGASMVEGRISQGVVVGDGSDIGGGASIMGTLSGGGAHRVSVGERTLLGANAGIGISLGDDCVVEAGLYVTAGTRVVLVDETPDASGAPPIVKAATLSGRSGVLWRRNSVTGAVEVARRSGIGVALNDALHA